MNKSTEQNKPLRQKIGPVDGDPVTTNPDLESLTPHQRALRLAVISEFKAKKVKKFVEKQVQHINTNQRIAEGIKVLFDEHGQPPANAPIEDIIEERRLIEYQIRWFEAVVIELQDRLVKVKEVEDYALDMLEQSMPED
ncbi:MAG: hypothetical protein HKP37_06260 [Boseongicola sp.]|nr:hypothetical protein [Boseongicola sp.]